MRWGKIVLAFQAVMTLIIGIVFLTQVFNIEYNYEVEVQEQEDQTSSGINTLIVQEKLIQYNKYKTKFFRASYILIIISLMEIIIIWRLFDTGPVTSYDTKFNFQSNYNLKPTS
jgi:hypothetical protein